MTDFTLSELKRLSEAATPGARTDLDGLRRLLANPCCGACVIKAAEAALPALLREAEAGRKLREAIRCGYCVDELEKCAACKAMAEYDAAVQCGTI